MIMAEINSWGIIGSGIIIVITIIVIMLLREKHMQKSLYVNINLYKSIYAAYYVLCWPASLYIPQGITFSNVTTTNKDKIIKKHNCPWPLKQSCYINNVGKIERGTSEESTLWIKKNISYFMHMREFKGKILFNCKHRGNEFLLEFQFNLREIYLGSKTNTFCPDEKSHSRAQHPELHFSVANVSLCPCNNYPTEPCGTCCTANNRVSPPNFQ